MSKGWAFINCDDIICAPSGGGSVDTSRDPLPATIGTVPLNFTNFGQVYYGTMTGDITFNFINPTLWHTVMVELTGNFVPSFPPECENYRGVYNGSKDNVIVIQCVDDVTPKFFCRIYVRNP